MNSKEEIDSHASEYIDIIGVNNRDLRDFTTDIETSIALAEHIPTDFIKISESGISNADAILRLKSVGYDGFLIGGYFMEHGHPEDACARLIKEVLSR